MNFLTHTIYIHDSFIQIYAASYAFGCVYTYMHVYIHIYISMHIFGIYQNLICIEVRAREWAPLCFSRLLSCIRAFVSAAVLRRAGWVFLWIASKYTVSTFLGPIGIRLQESQVIKKSKSGLAKRLLLHSKVTSYYTSIATMKKLNRLPASKLVVHTAPR